MGLGQTVKQLGGGLAALGVRVNKPAAAIPLNTTDALFVVYYGKILLTSIMGQVTEDINIAGNLSNLIHNPAAGATPLCGTLDITGDLVDTVYTITGTVGDPMQSDEKAGVEEASLPNLLILQPGTIVLSCANATGTGSIKWVMQYVALDKYAVVRPAA